MPGPVRGRSRNHDGITAKNVRRQCAGSGEAATGRPGEVENQMARTIDDVMAEMRKLTNSKPVHALAGAGVLATRTLKDLPWRLVRWTRDNPPNSLPGRATGAVQSAQTRATGAVQSAQTRATGAVQSAQTRATGAVQSAQTRATGAVQSAQTRATGAVQSAQTRATGAVQSAQTRATGYVQTARAKASDSYDTLAAHGKEALDGQSNGTEGKSTADAESKPELNGKARAKAPTRPTTSK